MGTVIEEQAAGLCCASCGTYFEHAHGYPVLCRGCWLENDPGRRGTLAEAEIPETVLWDDEAVDRWSKDT